MEDEERDLPEGWIRQFDEQSVSLLNRNQIVFLCYGRRSEGVSVVEQAVKGGR